MRFFSGFVFVAVGAFVYWYDATHAGGQTLILPGLDMLIPRLARDHAEWGRLSAYILAGVGVLLLLRAMVLSWRERDDRDDADTAERQ